MRANLIALLFGSMIAVPAWAMDLPATASFAEPDSKAALAPVKDFGPRDVIFEFPRQRPALSKLHPEMLMWH